MALEQNIKEPLDRNKNSYEKLQMRQKARVVRI